MTANVFRPSCKSGEKMGFAAASDCGGRRGSFAVFAQHPEQLLEDSGTEAIRAAVQRSALQCYAVEGVYPSSLEYLEENYGLQVNHEDYYVTYEAFASNMPPTVRVVLRR